VIEHPGESFTNVATVKGSEKEHKTEEPEAKTEIEPEFTIKKFQRFEGETKYTKQGKIGKVGEVVEYEVVIRNTGKVPFKLLTFTDTKCEDIRGPKEKAEESAPEKTRLEPGQVVTLPGEEGEQEPGIGTAFFLCKHTLETTGKYVNEAEIEVETDPVQPGARPAAVKPAAVFVQKKKSNEVEVEIPAGPFNFEIEKEQKLEGEPESAWTRNQINAKLNQVVDYRIIVTNLGAETVEFAALEDKNCTNIAPAGPTRVEGGKSETFTCEHRLTAYGEWVNEAVIMGKVGNKTKIKNSNAVIVDPEFIAETPIQSTKAQCAISESVSKLRGARGVKRHPFVAGISSIGIEKITFYLDGRKLKTLLARQARRGVFMITINPRKLSYGAHTLSVKTVMKSAACGKIKRSAVFIRPRGAR
jgi:hypothetical protein